ncbi:MAG: hypothetical protein K6B75_01575, partial [Lachnospiraceae bacterium]|nr:hypothetical protein [Lachnospiraceae bacterium]
MRTKTSRTYLKETVFGVFAETGIVLVTSWLFFDFSFISFLLFIYMFIAVKARRKAAVEKRKRLLEISFKDMLGLLRNAISAGYSPERSFEEAKNGLGGLYGEENEMVCCLNELVYKLGMGCPLEKALKEMARSCNVEDIYSFSDVFSVIKKTGGKMNEAIGRTAGVLQQKMELRREIHAQIGAMENEF